MNHRPWSVNTAMALILLNALIWLVFGMIVATGLHPAMPESVLAREAVALLAFLCAACLLALWLWLAMGYRIAYYMLLLVLGALVMATVMDQVELVDIIALAVIVAPMVLLIKDRKWYLGVQVGTR